MTFEDALKHFGSGKAIGDALGVTRSRVSQCRAAGGFSYPLQCVLEKESGGELMANRSDDPASHPKEATAQPVLGCVQASAPAAFPCPIE
jgi:hypothetical protein